MTLACMIDQMIHARYCNFSGAKGDGGIESNISDSAAVLNERQIGY